MKTEGEARIEGAKRPRFEGEARIKGVSRDKIGGEGSGEGAPPQKNFAKSNLKWCNLVHTLHRNCLIKHTV